MSEEVESVKDLPVEHALIDALAVPEQSMRLYREHIRPEMLVVHFDKNDEPRGGEKYGYQIMVWVYAFIDEYGVAPDGGVVADAFQEINFTTPVVPVDWIINKLRKRYSESQMKEIVSRIATHVERGQIDDAVAEGFHQFNRIKDQTASRINVIDVGASWEEDWHKYNQMILEGTLTGSTWGWPEVDQAIGGINFGLNFIVGRPGKGKSWAEIKAGIEQARQGHRVVIQTLEMSVDETYERVQCMIANVSYWRRVRGCLEPEERARFKEAMTQWREEDRKLWVVQPQVADRTVPGIYEFSKTYEPDIILIDQFKYIMPHRGNDRIARHERAEYICEDLKIMGDKVPFYVAAQLNREATKKENEGGDAEHVALSDALTQHADFILRIHQNKDMATNNRVELSVIKARRAMLHAWDLKMDMYDRCDLRLLGVKVDD